MSGTIKNGANWTLTVDGEKLLSGSPFVIDASNEHPLEGYGLEITLPSGEVIQATMTDVKQIVAPSRSNIL